MEQKGAEPRRNVARKKRGANDSGGIQTLHSWACVLVCVNGATGPGAGINLIVEGGSRAIPRAAITDVDTGLETQVRPSLYGR